jgi:dipeptidyl aminopeptidase/acylaminoacyl peptidase
MFKIFAIIFALWSPTLLSSSIAQGIELKTVSKPWVRVNQTINHLRLDPKNKFAAFIDSSGLGLKVLDLKDKAIYQVSKAQIGSSFFWSPDGYRIFYRELTKSSDNKVVSVLKAYDCFLHQSVTVEKMDYPTGILTFDPRDLRMSLMSAKGLKTKRIYFPDERLARWQVAQRTDKGKWVVTQKAVLWVTQGGYSIRKLEDDGSAIESFDISPDGSAIAWATKNGEIYTNRGGSKSKFLDHGRDPKWHPDRLQLIYSGARMVGRQAVNYDLKISDINGSKRFLTSSQFANERWPQWNEKLGQIVFTKDKTTDLYVLDFRE